MKKVDIRVRVVSDDAPMLSSACYMFQETTGLKLQYYGESRSVCTHRMLNALFVSRRLAIYRNVRQSIWDRQSGCCALCAEKLEQGKCECDHIKPLCLGGGNEQDNLRLLCKACHAEETDRLGLERSSEVPHD